MSEQRMTKKKVAKRTKPKYVYRPDEKAAALEAAGQIMNGFGWHLTTQGANYWNRVYTNLMKIAGRER